MITGDDGLQGRRATCASKCQVHVVPTDHDVQTPPPTLAVRPLAFPSHTLSSVLSYNHSIVHTAYSNYMNNKDNDDLKQNHLWI